MNEKAVKLTWEDFTLEGILGLPAQALGMVVFAHGSGSGRFSPRNNFVARYLQHGRVATLRSLSAVGHRADNLIIGGDDEPVIEMNRAAYRLLSCPKRLVIVPGASHLFEEPGTLEQVAEHALAWFQQYVHPAKYESTGAQTKERLR
ncbi:MAG: hypothetical protein ABIO96_12180 [Nitrospiraceae bacterium]